MNIAFNIQSIRKERGLTQNEVAERIGIDGSNYARQEKRGNKLTVEQLEKIATALEVSVIELLTGEVERVEPSEREEELENENEDLKERLKDKEDIIWGLENEINTQKIYCAEIISDYVQSVAKELGLGRLIYVKDVDTIVAAHGLNEEFKGFVVDISEEDQQQIARYIDLTDAEKHIITGVLYNRNRRIVEVLNRAAKIEFIENGFRERTAKNASRIIYKDKNK